MRFSVWLERFSDSLERNSPKITKKQDEYDDFPHIEIYFPDSNATWRYIFPDQFVLNRYWRHRLNVGRMLSKIKKDSRITQKRLS